MSENKTTAFNEACKIVAKKHGLGATLVTGHKVEYFREAAQIALESLQEPKGETAEEVLTKQFGCNENDVPFLYTADQVIKAMETYARQFSTPKEGLTADQIKDEAEGRYPVERHCNPSDSPYVASNKAFVYGANWALSVLHQGEREQKESGWISVSDRLPDETEFVLWCRVPICEPPYVGSILSNDFDHNYYTHWLPLANNFYPTETKQLRDYDQS